MIINRNMAGINILDKMNAHAKISAKSMEKISSGVRINHAADDAAGTAISEKMRSQIRGLEQAQKNIQEGINFIQTAEGSLAKIADPNLQRLRELAVQAANGTLSSNDRMVIQHEVNQIISDIDDVANNTKYNGIDILNVPKNEVIENVPSNEQIITVNPGERAAAGYIEVPEGANTGTLEVAAFFGTISDGVWPDLNIESPSGEWFGYGTANMSSSSNQESTSNNSSSKATYSGWGSSDEKMVFENPISGKWIIEIRNDGGSKSSTFKVQSNYLINQDNAPDVIEEPAADILIQYGANSGEVFNINRSDVRTAALGISDLKVDPWEEAAKSILKLDEAIQKVSSERGKFGAYQNALEHIHNNVEVSGENLTAAESRIRDTDMAKEIMILTKANILNQASQAMMAQANKQPQSILELLK
ncbi:flagellin [Planococcus chinensis]|uniref:Flagellin n=1 Tax=Planococcus chinensis TaxID=272917 RepID=A0ABW4QET0_9BACL